MALSYKARLRWSRFILGVGIPVYIVSAVTVMIWLGRPSFFVVLLVYIALGVVWALPLKFVFLGIGQADPDAPSVQDESQP